MNDPAYYSVIFQAQSLADEKLRIVEFNKTTEPIVHVDAQEEEREIRFEPIATVVRRPAPTKAHIKIEFDAYLDGGNMLTVMEER